MRTNLMQALRPIGASSDTNVPFDGMSAVQIPVKDILVLRSTFVVIVVVVFFRQRGKRKRDRE